MSDTRCTCVIVKAPTYDVYVQTPCGIHLRMVEDMKLQNDALRKDVERLEGYTGVSFMAGVIRERDAALRLNGEMEKVLRDLYGHPKLWPNTGDWRLAAVEKLLTADLRPNRETCRAPLPGGARCAFFMPCPDHGGRGDLSRACKVHNNQDCEMCAEKRNQEDPCPRCGFQRGSKDHEFHCLKAE